MNVALVSRTIEFKHGVQTNIKDAGGCPAPTRMERRHNTSGMRDKNRCAIGHRYRQCRAKGIRDMTIDAHEA
jgi:hypothetical protein